MVASAFCILQKQLADCCFQPSNSALGVVLIKLRPWGIWYSTVRVLACWVYVVQSTVPKRGSCLDMCLQPFRNFLPVSCLVAQDFRIPLLQNGRFPSTHIMTCYGQTVFSHWCSYLKGK